MFKQFTFKKKYFQNFYALPLYEVRFLLRFNIKSWHLSTPKQILSNHSINTECCLVLHVLCTMKKINISSLYGLT